MLCPGAWSADLDLGRALSPDFSGRCPAGRVTVVGCTDQRAAVHDPDRHWSSARHPGSVQPKLRVLADRFGARRSSFGPPDVQGQSQTSILVASAEVEQADITGQNWVRLSLIQPRSVGNEEIFAVPRHNTVIAVITWVATDRTGGDASLGFQTGGRN